MSDILIKVENLGKQYRLGDSGSKTFSQDIKRWVSKFVGREDPYLKIGQVNDRTKKSSSNDVVWALKDINFEVKQGEVLGIIGKNGAGKSTLLKILSRVTAPTVGEVKAKGRIASLLEVGTGFHPDLTGRENIFLNGAILGMTKQEIKSKLDEIIEFSGVERYIDTPVKRYSSGMYVRLAFGVSAHLESEILIVDEVLAVGDSEFQKKCLGKMKDVSGKGKTVLFVSHNISAVKQLCQKGILLKNGLLEDHGSVDSVIKKYFNLSEFKGERPDVNKFRICEIDQSPIYIKDVYVNKNSDFIPILGMGSEPEIIVEVFARKKIRNANITVSFYNSEGIKIGTAFSWDDEFYLNLDEGLHEIKFILKDKKITPGDYKIGVGLNQSDNTIAWDGINYYPIFNIENQINIEKFSNRRWGINHYTNNVWALNLK